MRRFALTYPQLMNQALELGLDGQALVQLRRAHDLAAEIARDAYRAQGVPLLCHLVRTASIVLAEGQPLPVVLASLLHAADVLERFDGGARAPHAARLRREMGDGVASLVSRYSRVPWHSRAHVEEHLRHVDGYADDERRLLAMRLANELEDHLDGAMDFTPPARARRRREAYGREAVALAERLGLPCLAGELREVLDASAPRTLPAGIILDHRQAYTRPQPSIPGRMVRGLAGVLARAREHAGEAGARGVLVAGLARLGYQRAGWFVRSLEPPWPAADARVAVEIRPVETPAEYETLRRDAHAEHVLQRLGAGHLCLAAFQGGEVVSATWVGTGRVRLSLVELVLDSHEICIYDSFTAPRFRGKRIQAAILARALARYHAAGYRRAIVLIVPENRANVRSRERSGFQRTGTIHVLHIGPWRWSRLRGARE